MSKKWTIEDVELLIKAGKVKIGSGFFPEKKEKPKPISFNEKPKGKQHIEFVLLSTNIEYQTEKMFVPDRNFRSDYFIPSLNLLIEYEGIYSEKSRHTFFKGYSKDVEKYNYACIFGYRLLRYTADNYKNFDIDLKKIIQLSNGR